MSEVYLQMIHKNIMNTTNRWTLMKLENQIEEYIKQNEQILFQNGTIEDVLDIRDAIITRISRLRREELLKSYTEANQSNKQSNNKQSNNKQSNNKQSNNNQNNNKQYYCLIEKKIQLERELYAINNELLVLVK